MTFVSTSYCKYKNTDDFLILHVNTNIGTFVKYSVFSFSVMQLSGNRFTSIISSDSHVYVGLLVLYLIGGTEKSRN